MTENEATTEPETLGEVAYAAFGELLAGENVTFGCGLPFSALPLEVQEGFEKAGSALIRTPAAAAWNGPAGAEEEAPSGVTVFLANARPDQHWKADAIEVEEGALLIGTGEKDGLAEIRAVYAPGQWTHAGFDAHRATSGPDHAATAGALERVLREVGDAAAGDTYDDETARESITRIIRRFREAGK